MFAHRPRSPTAARSPSGSSARCAALGIAHASRSTPTPTRGAPHVRGGRRGGADRPAAAAESYLDHRRAIVAAAAAAAREAVHPGYGFLAENAALRPGLRGGRPGLRRAAAGGDRRDGRQDRGQARRWRRPGVPVVPGCDGAGLTDAELAGRHGRARLPGADQAVGGRRRQGHAGGRATPAELADAIAAARREARRRVRRRHAARRAVRRPRRGTSRSRCSPTRTATSCTSASASARLQRRHQKIIEEAPSPLLSPRASGAAMGAGRAVAAAAAVGYVGAGTVEFIVDGDRAGRVLLHGDEHPAAGRAPGHRAASTGLDLVEWQLRVAAGEPLPFAQDDVAVRPGTRSRRGCTPRTRRAASCRPAAPVLALREPAGARGPGRLRRSPRAVTVTSDYDPMLAKVIAWGPDRRDRAAPPRPGPGRYTRARGHHQRRRSCARCSPTRTCGPGGSTPGWSSGIAAPGRCRQRRLAAATGPGAPRRGAGRGGARPRTAARGRRAGPP